MLERCWREGEGNSLVPVVVGHDGSGGYMVYGGGGGSRETKFWTIETVDFRGTVLRRLTVISLKEDG
jgi:hypothetical protein